VGTVIHYQQRGNPKRTQRWDRIESTALFVRYSVCETGWWRPIIHRRNRCDLSLFQLGLRFLEHLLNEDMPIPVEFHVTIDPTVQNFAFSPGKGTGSV
jgi:hypothetical protein